MPTTPAVKRDLAPDGLVVQHIEQI